MGSIALLNYWPFDLTQKQTIQRKFHYQAVDGSMPDIVSVFYYDPKQGCLIQKDYSAPASPSTWKDDWLLQYHPGFGIAEIGDNYPGKTVRFSTPIGWGDTVDVGQVYTNSPTYNPFACSPPQIGSGWQAVNFEALLPSFTDMHGVAYNNVLQFAYQQSWNGGQSKGARYWFALGVGPVALQWMAPVNGQWVISSRMDAIVKEVPAGTYV